MNAIARSKLGIGLAMVKRIVDILNGDVGLSSAPSEGSTFWIDLPVAKTTVL
jgi:signal transduction histidine kinase